MNKLSQECIEQINKEVNLQWDAYPHYKKLEVKDSMIQAITNPTIYQSANLMTVEEALRFTQWCVSLMMIRPTADLLTIFRNQNQEK
jgi:hypothetical protein